jgi:hypothetical protein
VSDGYGRGPLPWMYAGTTEKIDVEQRRLIAWRDNLCSFVWKLRRKNSVDAGDEKMLADTVDDINKTLEVKP